MSGQRVFSGKALQDSNHSRRAVVAARDM